MERVGKGDRSERSDGNCNASGHSADAGQIKLYTVLMNPVAGEWFDILVRSGSGEGLEAWQRLHNVGDPLDGWKSERNAQRNPLLEVPSWLSCKEQWKRLEDLMRRYTQRRDARNGHRHTLAEDIRMAALEALHPEELERHCQLQRSTVGRVPEVERSCSLRRRKRYVAPKPGSGVLWLDKTEMILGRLEHSDTGKDEPFPKRKGKNPTGTGKGKGTGKDGAKSSGRAKHTEKFKVGPWNCGENSSSIKGLMGKATAAESRTIKFSWMKGKSGTGRGKKGKSKDAGEFVWNQQPSPVASTVDAIECTALDLCATALTQQEIVNPRWKAFNVDTGAGGTVWPMNATTHVRKFQVLQVAITKTATGEDKDGFVFVVKVFGDTYCH